MTSNYHNEESFADICLSLEQNPNQYLEWLELQPEFARLLETTENNKLELAPTSKKQQNRKKFKSFSQKLFGLLWPNSSALYGRAYVTSDLQKKAKQVGTLIGASSAINIISLFPLMQMAFANLGLLVGSTLSCGSTMLLLMMSNACGTIGAGSEPKNRIQSIIGLISFATLNITLTVLAGPGMETLNGIASLREAKAQEELQPVIAALVESDQKQLAHFKSQASDKRKECEKLDDQIDKLPQDNRNRDRIIGLAWGEHKDSKRDWLNAPFGTLPICHKAERLEKQADDFEQEMIKNQEKRETELALSHLTYLETHHRPTYKKHFDEQDRFKDPNEAVRLAVQCFFGQLTAGEWEKLGFPLAFFFLSLVTSSGAVAVVAIYANSQPATQSWNPVLERMRQQMFWAVDQGLARLASATDNASLPKTNGFKTLSSTTAVPAANYQKIFKRRSFLWLCAEQMRQSGSCDFPPFVRYIERHPKGEPLLPQALNLTDTSLKHEQDIWTSQPDVAITYLRNQISITCEYIAVISRALQEPNLYGEFSLLRATQALTQEIHKLARRQATIARNFPHPSEKDSRSLIDDLQYTQEWIRKHLIDTKAPLDEIDQGVKAARTKIEDEQVTRYLVKIETLALQLNNRLVEQLEAGISSPRFLK